jgi:hypothetical protein
MHRHGVTLDEDQVETNRETVRKTRLHQVGSRCVDDPPLLALVDGDLEIFKVYRFPALHFDEYERLIVFRDNIDLSPSRPEIPRQDAVSGAFEKFDGTLFAETPLLTARFTDRSHWLPSD